MCIVADQQVAISAQVEKLKAIQSENFSWLDHHLAILRNHRAVLMAGEQRDRGFFAFSFVSDTGEEHAWSVLFTFDPTYRACLWNLAAIFGDLGWAARNYQFVCLQVDFFDVDHSSGGIGNKNK